MQADIINKIKQLESIPVSPHQLVIENDNPVWTTFMRYGQLIKQTNLSYPFHQQVSRITSISKDKINP